jgi:tetratricopeptide (TPR) repeat protein
MKSTHLNLLTRNLPLILIMLMIGCDSKQTKLQRFLIQGNEMVQKQNFAQARKYFNEALRLDSCFADAWNNLGTISFQQHNYDEALNNYSHVIDCDKKFYPAYLNRANTFYELNRPEEGLRDLDVYQKNNPDTFVVHFSRGLLLTKQKKFNAALGSFRRALTMSQGNIEILVNLGSVHYYLHQLDSADKYLNRARNVAEDEPNIFNTLALINIERNRFDEAMKNINRAISLEPRNSFFLNNRGYIHLLSGDLAASVKDIDASISEDPYNAWAYRNKGLYYLMNKDAVNAVRLLKRAEEIDPTIDSLNTYLARSTYSLDKLEACGYYKKAKAQNEVSDQEFDRFCR